MGREGFDQVGDLGLVGIAYDVVDAGESGEFFGGALGVAAGDDYAGVGILGVDSADGVAGLGVGGGGYCAGVENDDGGVSGIFGGNIAAVPELAFQSGAIGLGGAAAELLDVEGGHSLSAQGFKKGFTQSSQRTPRALKTENVDPGRPVRTR